MNVRSQKALTTVTQNLPELRCALSDIENYKTHKISIIFPKDNSKIILKISSFVLLQEDLGIHLRKFLRNHLRPKENNKNNSKQVPSLYHLLCVYD